MQNRRQVLFQIGMQRLKMQSRSSHQTRRQAVKQCHFVIFTRQPRMLISGRLCLKPQHCESEARNVERALSGRLQFTLAAATVAALIPLYLLTDCSPKWEPLHKQWLQRRRIMPIPISFGFQTRQPWLCMRDCNWNQKMTRYEAKERNPQLGCWLTSDINPYGYQWLNLTISNKRYR